MENFSRLRQRLAEFFDIERAAALSSWDQQTFMPKGSAGARSDQLATLSRYAHEILTSDETGRLIDKAYDDVKHLAEDSDEACLVKVARRDYEKYKKIPPDLVEALARATSTAFQQWSRAKEESKFEIFRPHLEEVIQLTVKKAEALTYTENIYDPLLDIYEPDMTAAQVKVLFDNLKDAVVPLIQQIGAHSDRVSNAVLGRPFDKDKQFDFSVVLLKDIGFDFGTGRQDLSIHPFTTSFSVNDVRLTTRVNESNLAMCLFGTLHEGGHGMYEQGVASDLDRTVLANGASLGIHESQSRTWENLIGRSRPFWQHYYPKLRNVFPDQLGDCDSEVFYKAINRVSTSFIRVEADEVTYNLHILVRFELETALMSGDLKVTDLPEAWNAKMKEYLGITPPDDAHGMLQDIHWSEGMVGYFPTYTLGNIISCQLFDVLKKDIPDAQKQIGAGEFGPILSWYREKIHRHGRKYTATELVSRVTGGPVSADPFCAYIKDKFSDIYGLS
ncbi:carboxypeptidase M32 [Acidobacteriota bacterium]